MDTEEESKSEDAGDAPDAAGNPPITSFRVSKASVAALKKNNITHMFPIQAATFDLIFGGADVMGRARTGTGPLPIVPASALRPVAADPL